MAQQLYSSPWKIRDTILIFRIIEMISLIFIARYTSI